MAQFAILLIFTTFFVTIFVRDSISTQCIYYLDNSIQLKAPAGNLNSVPESLPCLEGKKNDIRLEGCAATGHCQIPASKTRLRAEHDFTAENDVKELMADFECWSEKGLTCETPLDEDVTEQSLHLAIPNSTVKAGNNYTVGFNVFVAPTAKGKFLWCHIYLYDDDINDFSCSEWNITIT